MPAMQPAVPEPEEPSLETQNGPGLARSAGLLSLGSAASRVLGLVREMLIAALFGATGMVSAFRVASQLMVLLYDFLVGGMLSAALVPVLSDALRRQSREEYARLVSALFGIFSLVLTLLVVALEVFAPQAAWLLAGGFVKSDPALLDLTVRLIRVLAPTVWLFSMAGALMAVLYSLQRFTIPALAPAVYNLGIVLAAPLLAERFGIYALAAGMLAGNVAQVALLGYDLWRYGLRLHLRINWRHPALARIAKLYAPIAAGLVVSAFQIGLDRRLASGTGEQSIAWMSNATTLQQMPLGLVSVAIALAALPRLSQYFALGQENAYRSTLADGLRLVTLLIVPAAVGLWLLGEPAVRLLFERNRFLPADTVQVAAALNIYVVGMLFAAIDFPLNYAFYARQNTLLPALVGVLSVGVYVAVALSLLGRMGYLGLVWADTAKQASHAAVMLGLLHWKAGGLDGRFVRAFYPIGLAALVMAAVIIAVQWVLAPALTEMGRWADPVVLAAGGGIGAAVYLGLLLRMRLPEAGQLLHTVRRRVK